MPNFLLVAQEAAQEAPEIVTEPSLREHSILSWMFQALGPFYGLLIPLSGLLLLLGAIIVVASNRRPAVIAAYLAFVPFPFLLGLMAVFSGAISSFQAVAMAGAAPKASELAEGWSLALFAGLVGLYAMLPGLLVTAVGLFLRTLTYRDSALTK